MDHNKRAGFVGRQAARPPRASGGRAGAREWGTGCHRGQTGADPQGRGGAVRFQEVAGRHIGMTHSKSQTHSEPLLSTMPSHLHISGTRASGPTLTLTHPQTLTAPHHAPAHLPPTKACLPVCRTLFLHNTHRQDARAEWFYCTRGRGRTTLRRLDALPCLPPGGAKQLGHGARCLTRCIPWRPTSFPHSPGQV